MAPDNQNWDRAGSGATTRRDRGSYLEQPESGHPADAALLVLRAQHPQLLCLLQDFVWLLKEVKEDVVSVPSQSEARLRLGQTEAALAHTDWLGVPTGAPRSHHAFPGASARLTDGHAVAHRESLHTDESIHVKLCYQF